MRVESIENKNEFKCWLSPDEIETLEAHAKQLSHRHYCIILLGSKVGLRAVEMTVIRPTDIKQQYGHYFARVVGKDTTGRHRNGKQRDAYLPEVVERELLELRYTRNVDENQPYFDVTVTRIRQMVREAAEKVAEETGNTDWTKLSSHDLGRYFAQTCLVRESMNPRVVMSVGGWESFEGLKPYLNEPVPEQIADDFEEAGLN
jgi:integrase